jgi:hypothetical protein
MRGLTRSLRNSATTVVHVSAAAFESERPD